jgi:phosphoribosyl 1,2-cyclic phosphodiesterase
MKVVFWGTCGSIPSPITARGIEVKIEKAFAWAESHPRGADEPFGEYLKKMPFAIRGTYGGNTSCVELVGGEDTVLCDAGTGLRDFSFNLMMKELDRLPGTFHIFISHPHWDHIQGFPFFTPAYIAGNRVFVYGCHEELEKAFRIQQGSPFFPVDFDSLGADIRFVRLDPDKTHSIAGFNVTIMEQDHPGRSFGYRFEKDGASVVYSSDAEHRIDMYDESYQFIEFFRNADLLIFDAQYIFSDSIIHKENWGHSSNVVAVELALRSGVRHLCLFHMEHTFDDEALNQMMENTQGYRKHFTNGSEMELTIACDGLEISL